MTFEEWFHKEYEPADLQIKQCAERNEGLHIPAKVYLEDLKKAYEAGLYADVHTDNSKVIAELEAQIEKMKCCVVSHCEGCERLPELYKELENENKEM
jgi:hypothetical protein